MTRQGGVPADLFRALRNMWMKDIADSSRSGAMRNSSISAGGRLAIKGGALVVEGADGGLLLYVGGISPSLPDGTYQPGMTLRREDGTLAMALYDPDPDPDGPGDYKQFLALYDREQRVIVSDDTSSGQGLARPYLPGVFYRERYADWVTTTSGSFETLFTAVVYKQHPRLYVQVWASNDTPAATGEVRVTVNGVPWGSVASTGFTVATSAFGPLSVGGDHMEPLTVRVQARLASGAGGVRVEPRVIEGMQS